MRGLVSRTFLLRESPTRRIDAIREKLAKEKREIYLLSTGQPSIPPPIEMREYLSELLKEESMKLYGYTQSQGIGPLREAIVEDLKELGGIDLDADRNIVVTAGGQEAMFSALSAILEEGDEVILMDPTYFGYKPLIEYFGGRIKYSVTDLERKFQPDIDEISEIVSKKTKAIVIVSPDNPTGRVLNPKVGKAIADLAGDYDFWIIMDEAYKTLIYEGEHFWFWRYQPERTIGIDTFSKDPGMPGWRLGFVYGPEDVIKAVKLLNEEIVYCPPSFAQVAVTYYLKSRLREKFLPKVIEIYKSKRDALARAIDKDLSEAKFMKAQGSMFMFVDFSKYLREMEMSSVQFAEELLEKTGVAIIPGSFFGHKCDNYIRFSFVTESIERMERAVGLIREFIETKVKT